VLRLLEKTAPVNLEGTDRFAFRWGLGYILFLVAASGLLFRLLGGSGGVEQWQSAVSWLAFGTLLFVIVAANSYYKFDATDESEREHLRAIRPQLINVSPTGLTITRAEFDDSLAGYHDRISALFDGQRPDDVATVRESLAEFRCVWSERSRVLPGLATKLLSEAALILLTGAVLFLPVSWWSGGESAGFNVTLEPLIWLLGALATAFPGSEVALPLGLSLVLLVGEALYHHYLALALVLIAGAVVITWLDRVTAEDLSVVLYPERRVVAVGVVGTLTLIYVVGAGIATVVGGLFGLVGLSIIGDVLGLLAAGYIAVAFGRDAIEDLRARLVTRQEWPDENTELVATYLACRKVFATAGVVSLPLLLAYAVSAVGSGRIFAVALELTRAPWTIKLPAIGVVILTMVLVARNYPDLVSQLVTATRSALSSQLVRGFLFTRGIPILAVVVGFGLSFPFAMQAGPGIPVAILIGVVVGILARLATMAWQASKYRFVSFVDRDSGRREVVVEAFTLEDANGEPIYVARVDGHELAHRDKDVVVRVALKEVRACFEHGETEPSFAHYYYEEATEHGHVDIGFVADEYRGDIKTRIDATLRKHDGELEVKKLDKEMMEEYADAAYRKAIRELEGRGEIDVRLGKYVLH